MDRHHAPPHRRGLRRMTNSRRTQTARLILTTVLALCSVGLLGLGIAAWSLPETPEVHVTAGKPVQLHRSPPLSEGQVIFVSKQVQLNGTGPDEVLTCTLTRDSSTTSMTTTADPSIGERARHRDALRPVLAVGTTDGNESMTCSGTAVASGAVWLLPTRVGVPFRALVVTIAGIGLLGMALLVHFGRVLAKEG